MMQVFLDCDGVLADFDQAGELLWSMHPRKYEALVGSEKFWKELETHTDFYGTLPLMHKAEWLADACWALTGHPPIILTGCPRGGWAEAQKLAWGKRHFPQLKMITTMSANKRDHAKAGDILIDDYLKYRHLWEDMGGIFIHYQNAVQAFAELMDVVEKVAR